MAMRTITAPRMMSRDWTRRHARGTWRTDPTDGGGWAVAQIRRSRGWNAPRSYGLTPMPSTGMPSAYAMAQHGGRDAASGDGARVRSPRLRGLHDRRTGCRSSDLTRGSRRRLTGIWCRPAGPRPSHRRGGHCSARAPGRAARSRIGARGRIGPGRAGLERRERFADPVVLSARVHAGAVVFGLDPVDLPRVEQELAGLGRDREAGGIGARSRRSVPRRPVPSLPSSAERRSASTTASAIRIRSPVRAIVARNRASLRGFTR